MHMARQHKRGRKVVRRTKLEALGARGAKAVKRGGSAAVGAVAAVAVGAYLLAKGFGEQMFS
jgi:hypothetical protein